MNQRQVRNLAASIRDRLRQLAREQNEEFQLVLTHFAIDRLLYRLSISPHADTGDAKAAGIKTSPTHQRVLQDNAVLPSAPSSGRDSQIGWPQLSPPTAETR